MFWSKRATNREMAESVARKATNLIVFVSVDGPGDIYSHVSSGENEFPELLVS